MRRLQVLISSFVFGFFFGLPTFAAVTDAPGECVEVIGDVISTRSDDAVADLRIYPGTRSEARFRILPKAPPAIDFNFEDSPVRAKIGVRSAVVGRLRGSILRWAKIRVVGPDPLQKRTQDGVRSMPAENCDMSGFKPYIPAQKSQL